MNTAPFTLDADDQFLVWFDVPNTLYSKGVPERDLRDLLLRHDGSFAIKDVHYIHPGRVSCAAIKLYGGYENLPNSNKVLTGDDLDNLASRHGLSVQFRERNGRSVDINGGRYFDATHDLVNDHKDPLHPLPRAAAVAMSAPEPKFGAFQTEVGKWVRACFGEQQEKDLSERRNRFLEEALELGQASGMHKEDALALVDYVFSREKGEVKQEVGGVMTTLAALCNVENIDIKSAAAEELGRIQKRIKEIRAKHASKPKGSPLPGKSPA
ncbi:hypothetical protein ACYPKM_03160 [Pseudomonas aeruginosa]